MSYKRSYKERIKVDYKGHRDIKVNYPGGSKLVRVDYDGTTYEDVTVNIKVDTDPFDNSVAGCKNTVNLLTGAVVATETAQVLSIDKNAKKVGQTIVDGFFKTIRSEISQQITELASRVDATLIHLLELKKRCEEKRQQMETDYNRIASRYLKIFDDLNSELENRIFELDRPDFVFKKESDNQAIRISGNDLVSTVAVFGAEGGVLQAKISASIAKKRALDTIGKANVFLVKQKKLNMTINQSMLNENIAATHYSPICLIETCDKNGQTGKSVYMQDFLSQTNQNEIIEDFKNLQWSVETNDNNAQIQRYFNAEVSNHFATADPHASRVKDNIVKMCNFNSIKVCNQKK
jgi:hypothetical protein